MQQLEIGSAVHWLWLKRVISVLMFITLLVLLTACGTTKTKVVEKRVVEKVCPPTTLTLPASAPKYTGAVWADLVTYIHQLRSVIDKQNADKAAIAKFCEEE